MSIKNISLSSTKQIGFMNNPFVRIVPTYLQSQERIIENLRIIYENRGQLVSYIKKALSTDIIECDVVGKRILIKPNWVKHSSNPQDEICLCTHPNFILALVEILLEWRPASILIADAPVQGCDWSRLLTQDFLEKIDHLSVLSGVSIIIKDFRRVAFSPVSHELEKDKHPLDDYIVFDVGDKSYLEDITSNKNLFRVTCYDPDRLAESHHKGVHKYCIAKDVFDCDLIITMPKIKTHQKSGLTNSMKVLVGINGDKDFLPHHRIGAVECGGDCYQGKHPLRRMSELVIDAANRRQGKWLYHPLSYLSAALWRLSFPTKEQNLAAGWYGNDTVWRMVMDLNMIALYGKNDGSLSDIRQRTLYTLCDGIIGGQGNGPLSPEPLPLGLIAFSNDAFAMDEVAGRLFKLNLEKVPLLKEASRINNKKEIDYYINDNKVGLSDIDSFSMDVIMPPGWVNYNKK